MDYSLITFHPKLFDLYTGPDASFKSLTCVKCARLAYEPYECSQCQRLTCLPCIVGKVGTCNFCSQTLQKNVHFLALQILQNARFRCPFDCLETSLQLTQIEDHVRQCPNLIQACPNGCETILHVSLHQAHRKECSYEPVQCQVCGQTVIKKLLGVHKMEQCEGMVECQICQNSYPTKNSHGLEDCVVYLAQLVKQLQLEKLDREVFVKQLIAMRKGSFTPKNINMSMLDEDLARDQDQAQDEHLPGQESVQESDVMVGNPYPQFGITSEIQNSRDEVLGKLRFSSLCGKKNNKHYFEYPPNLSQILKSATFQPGELHQIQCEIADSITSMRLLFKDNTQTPKFGSTIQGAIQCQLEVPSDEQINMITIRHSIETASIQNVTFETIQGTEIEFNGKLCDGQTTQIQVLNGEKIVGCYGYCWSSKQPEIVGLGFVIWTPNQTPSQKKK